MNWHRTLQEIYSKLELNGLGEVSREIKDEQLQGGTGGEIFGLVMTKLIQIKNKRPRIYSVIAQEVDALIEYGKSIGYL